MRMSAEIKEHVPAAVYLYIFASLATQIKLQWAIYVLTFDVMRRYMAFLWNVVF